MLPELKILKFPAFEEPESLEMSSILVLCGPKKLEVSTVLREDESHSFKHLCAYVWFVNLKS